MKSTTKQKWDYNSILLLISLLSIFEGIDGQCRLTCLQTDNQFDSSSYSNVWSPSSLVFILDTTESMINEIQLVRREIDTILQIINARAEEKACKPIDNYIIYPFNDPQLGPMYRSDTIAGFRANYAEVESQVKGGGDCAEPVLSAVLNVLNNITDNSFVFIFTDGAAKDARLKQEVIQKIKQTNSYVVFVLIGDHCSNEGLDYISSQLYDQISQVSGGNAIFVKRTESTVGNVVKLISLFVKPKSVTIMDINQLTPSNCIYIPVDASLCDLVVTVRSPTSQNMKKVKLRSPGNKAVRPRVKTDSVRAWEVDGPTVGTWKVCFGRSLDSMLSLQVRGSSDIDFAVTLTKLGTGSEVREVRGGEVVGMSLRIFGVSTDNVQTVEFIDLAANVITPIHGVRKSTSNPSISVLRVALPTGIFKIRIKGIDNRDNPFERISNGIFGEPDEPTWVIEPPSTVYAVLRNNFTIEAIVTGDPFPSIVWQKDGVVLNTNNRIQLLAGGTLIITRIIDTDVGRYQITATNQAGSITKQIQLALWEAPYFTREPQKEILGNLNRPLIIDLTPRGNPPPVCRWLYKGAAVNGAGQSQCSYHIRLLNELTCGDYRVIIENSVASITFLIAVTFTPVCNVGSCHYEPPTVGRKLLLETNCIGCPTRCDWTRNGVQISSNSKYTIHNNCTLRVRNYQTPDQGSYILNLLDNDNNIADREVIKINNRRSLSIIEPDWNERLVQVSTDFKVACRSVGLPLPTLSWSINGRPINKAVPTCTDATSLSLELTFDRIQKRSEGEYKCTARNKFESIEKTIRIYVNSTIDVDVTPEVAEVTIGEIVFIHCQITNRGRLTPSVVWYKRGNEVLVNSRIRIFSNNTLSFKPVLEIDKGIYECRALTTREINSGYADLKPTPKTFYYNPLDRVTVCLVCPLLAGEAPTWERDDSQLVNSNKYTISADDREICLARADCTDEGSYICGTAFHIPVRLRDINQVCENLVNQRPSFRDRQQALIVTSGDTARMTCQVTGVPQPTIKWFRNRDEPITNDERTTLTSSSSYTAGDRSFVYKSSVAIQLITMEDQGRYSCNATNKHGYSNNTFQMQVTLPQNADRPHLTEKSQTQEICEGDGFSLYCKFNSTLTPISYRWHFSIEQITPSQNVIITHNHDEKTTRLRIVNSAIERRGTYTCEARNILGNARDSVYVDIGERREIGFAYFSGDTTAYIGDSLTLFCRVDSSVTSVEISWYKGSEFVSRGERLIFDTVYMSIAGEYTCRIVGCGSNKEKSLVLDVRESRASRISFISPPQVVIEGDPAFIHCTAIGDPQPRITWLKRTRVLSNNSRTRIFENGTLTIRVTYELDGSEYTCLAANTAGQVTLTTSLDVLYAAQIYISNIKVSPGKTVTPGSSLTFDCVIVGQPVEEFGWYHRGNRLTSGGRVQIDSERRLTIRDITSSHSGEYKCSVANRNTIKKQEIVTIYVGSGSGPVLNPNAPTSLRAILYSRVRIDCPFTSTSRQRFEWERNGRLVEYTTDKRQLLTNGSLVINDFSVSDVGEYVCSSRNSLGSGRYEISVLLPITWLRRPASQVELEIGSDLVLNVEVVSHPQASFRWIYNSREVTDRNRFVLSNSGATLTISNVRRSDAGIYTVEIRQQSVVRGKNGNPDIVEDTRETFHFTLQ